MVVVKGVNDTSAVAVPSAEAYVLAGTVVVKAVKTVSVPATRPEPGTQAPERNLSASAVAQTVCWLMLPTVPPVLLTVPGLPTVL